MNIPEALEKLANSEIGLITGHRKPTPPILLGEKEGVYIVGPTETDGYHVHFRRSQAHYSVSHLNVRFTDVLVKLSDETRFQIFQRHEDMPNDITYTEVPYEAYINRNIDALLDKYPNLLDSVNELSESE